MAGGPEAAAAPTYRNPARTVDGVVLVREPFPGCHALPGGFVAYGEDVDAAIACDDAAAAWFPVTALPELAFDHAHILERVLASEES